LSGRNSDNPHRGFPGGGWDTAADAQGYVRTH
jgi:hypothetical protein